MADNIIIGAFRFGPRSDQRDIFQWCGPVRSPTRWKERR